MSSGRVFRFDLVDVPFKEKNIVKQLGAKWDTSKKVWYYNGDLSYVEPTLMEWNPRVYLDVPFNEKDEARDDYGCNWDPKRKKWYLHAGNMYHYTDWEGLARWLPQSPVPFTFRSGQKVVFHGLKEDIYLNGTHGRLISYDEESDRWTLELLHNGHTVTGLTKNLKCIQESPIGKSKQHPRSTSQPADSSTKTTNKKNLKKPPPTSTTVPPRSTPSFLSATARAGNSKQATMLRINDYMTVQQLQDECRHRGTIKGYSNKTKAWLLDQLVIGSVWQQNAAPPQHDRNRNDDSQQPKKKKKKRGTREDATASSDGPRRNKKKSKHQPELGDLNGNHDSPYLYDQLGFSGYHMEMNRRHEEEEAEEEGDY
jgi:Domain of unknown function (DUF5710)